MAGHEAVAVRRGDGYHRWFGSCPCGWTENGSSKQEAEALAKKHQRENTPTADLLLQVLDVANEMRCDCYEFETMDYSPTKCLRCRLLELCGAE